MKSISVSLIALPLVVVLTLRCGFSPLPTKSAVTEKSIVKFTEEESKQVTSVKYDRSTGAYAYMYYDSTKDGAYVVTRSGRTDLFSGVSLDNSFFDKQGNFYSTAYKTVNETVVKFYLLKNSQSIAEFDNINDNWAQKEGRLFFEAKENGKSFMAACDLSSGEIQKGKAYDDLILCGYPETPLEDEEYDGIPGFTKDGKPFYIAVSGSKQLLVVGNDEQKPYAYIDPYSVVFDKMQQPVYIANDKMVNDMPSDGNYFLVQGSKEYDKYNFIYNQVVFDKDNQPLYSAEAKDSKGDKVSTRLCLGSKVINLKYSEGFCCSMISPQGKVVFVGQSLNKNNEEECCVVVDGKEGKKYSSIINLTFTPAGVPMYIALDRGREFIVKGEERITADYPSILEYGMLKNGKFAFAVFEQGDYEKKIPDKYYVVAAGTQYGPYDNLKIGEGDIGKSFLADDQGNFAAQTYRYIPEAGSKEECTVITNKGLSEKFDDIGDMKLIAGKTYFVGNMHNNNGNYFETGKVYCDFKPISEEYKDISELTDDANNSAIGFTGVRSGEAFWVEIKY